MCTLQFLLLSFPLYRPFYLTSLPSPKPKNLPSSPFSLNPSFYFLSPLLSISSLAFTLLLPLTFAVR